MAPYVARLWRNLRISLCCLFSAFSNQRSSYSWLSISSRSTSLVGLVMICNRFMVFALSTVYVIYLRAFRHPVQTHYSYHKRNPPRSAEKNLTRRALQISQDIRQRVHLRIVVNIKTCYHSITRKLRKEYRSVRNDLRTRSLDKINKFMVHVEAQLIPRLGITSLGNREKGVTR